MIAAKYTFQRGETISLALDILEGQFSAIGDIAASLKRAGVGWSAPLPETAVAAVFDIAPRAADGDAPGGWNLTIDAVQSGNLAPGNYLADARLAIEGGVIITDSVGICIKAGVT